MTETSKQQLLKNITKHIELSEEEQELYCSFFKEAKIKKRQFIVQPNFTAKHKNFVVSGSFRSYLVCDDGMDHTISFAIEDWWITDYNSYIYQQPATLFVVALEDSVILQLDYNKDQEMLQANRKFENFFRVMAERAIAFNQRRIITNLTQKAEVRLKEFEEKYPSIALRMPQYAVASYLGMTTEYLSKIRNKRTQKS